MTTLHLAAKNGHIDCCKVLLKKRPSMINWKDKGGWTPLVWACENSHIEIVKYDNLIIIVNQYFDVLYKLC